MNRLPAAGSSTAASVGLVRRFARPHARWFYHGAGATVFVVVFRLAMPWPLRHILEMAQEIGAGGGVPPAGWLQSTILMAGTYVVIATLLGFSELRQRVTFKRYAARTVHDMRAAVVDALGAGWPRRERPDLLSRVIADTARVKAEMSGILVHVSQNGFLFIAVCGVFAVLSPLLSAFFLAAGCFAIAVGYRATKRIRAVTKQQREKEGEYAAYVQDLLSGRIPPAGGTDVNETSARHDVTATRLIAVAAWTVQVGLAIITGGALVVAMREVLAGRIQLGEVFLFIAYALILHRRMIQVGRQLARGGKLIANVARVGELLQLATNRARAAALPRLATRLEVISAKVPTANGAAAAPLSLAFDSGTKTAIVDQYGTAASSLVRACAGATDSHGEVLWDGRHVAAGDLRVSREIGYVPAAPDFPCDKLRRFVGERSHAFTNLGRALGLPALVEHCGRRLKAPVSSVELTRLEAQAVMLARLVWNAPADVWLVDDPVSGLSPKKARRLVRCLLEEADGRTVVMALPYLVSYDRFDRVIVLHDACVVFDGSPKMWQRRLRDVIARAS